MAYSQITFAALRNQLAARINDPAKSFTPDAELKIHIQDAIRFWNILTGEFKQNYALSVSNPNIWYDLFTIAGSPRLCTLKDTDIYTRLQYGLLEPPAANAALTTAQFTSDDLVSSVQRKRDEFLFRTSCVSAVKSLGITPNVATVNLPQTVMQARRAYWLPQSGSSSPVFKSDDYATSAYQRNDLLNPGTPLSFIAGVEPQLMINLVPSPNGPGTIEVLTTDSQAALSLTSATTLLIPSDFVPGLFWGAMSDLLMITLEAQDITRAQYAKQRFDEYVALTSVYPFVMTAKASGIPLFVDAVETLDLYSPSWRSVTANPSILGISGQNLVAFPTATNMQVILFMVSNATVPVNDGDFIQLGDEILDCVLDEAASTAQFKLGGSEAASAASLHANIIKLAAQKNMKIRGLSCFKEDMYQKPMREDKFTVKEVVAE